VPAGVEVRVDGNALLTAVRYELERLRCSACGQVFTAPLPAEAGEAKYTVRARAVLVLSRYSLGVPSYRLEGFQRLLGVPVADATQWELVEQVADCAYPVFEQLKYLAAQGEVIYHDDTATRILAVIRANRKAAESGQAASGYPDVHHVASGRNRRMDNLSLLCRAGACGGESGSDFGPAGTRARPADREVGCALGQHDS